MTAEQTVEVSSTLSLLEGRVRQLRAEIRQAEAAQEPASDLLAREMARFDGAAAAFEAAPYRPRLWSPGPPSWDLIEHMVKGAMGALVPGAREHFERHVTQKLSVSGGLRLSQSDKSARLDGLTAALRRAEVALEVARRREEQATGQIVPRTDASPEIWLMFDEDLMKEAA